MASDVCDSLELVTIFSKWLWTLWEWQPLIMTHLTYILMCVCICDNIYLAKTG